MASVTVNLTGYVALTDWIGWGPLVSLGGTFERLGRTMVLATVKLYDLGPNMGRVELGFSGMGTVDFTTAFEATGRIIFTASDGETVEVMIANADMIEPYIWVPTNSAEVIAFASHVRALTDNATTLTLTDDPPAPGRPAAPTLTGTDTSITAVGLEPDGDPTSYDWRIKRTSSSIWADRLDQTSLTQTWPSLQPDTEYEVQFRATNSDGDSAYSPSGILTTDMQTTPPVGFTNIPTPVAGDEWTREQFILYVVDNLNAIHALVTGTTPGTTFAENDVVIGDTGGALQGVDLPNGALLVGSAGAPVPLAIGSTGKRLTATHGVLSWETP